MEQIITEKAIIITPEKTKKQTLKRGLSTLENLKQRGIYQERVVVEKQEKNSMFSSIHEDMDKVEKRVKLSTTPKKSKVVNNKNTLSCDNDTSSLDSTLDINGANICCFSLLSSCASLQENNQALSQISTSYSNLDDETLSESSNKLQLVASPSNITTSSSSNNEQYLSSHFLSQKVLSDDDEDNEIEEEEDDSIKSSSNPIPNLTSLQSFDLSCPLHGQSLSSTNDITSQPTIASLQVEDKSSSSNKLKPKIINSASFIHREHTKKWSNDETLKFYKGLELFGTDFSMISRLFMNRTRKMCKNKFRKEEKINMNEIEKRLLCNRSLRMKKVVQRLNAIRAKLSLKFARTTEERIAIVQNARRSRLDSFNSIDSLDINVVETIESQLNGQALF